MNNYPVYLLNQMHSIRYDRSKAYVSEGFLFLDAAIAEGEELMAKFHGPLPDLEEIAPMMSIFKEWNQKLKKTDQNKRYRLLPFLRLLFDYCLYCCTISTPDANQRVSRLPSSHGGKIGNGIIDTIFPLMPLDKPGCFIELGCNSGRLSSIVKLTHPHLYVVQIEKDFDRIHASEDARRLSANSQSWSTN